MQQVSVSWLRPYTPIMSTRPPGKKRTTADVFAERERSQRADQKLATRTRIAEAALAEFAAKGFRAASISAIAKRADISRSAVHFHFQTKIDLANEIGFAVYPEAQDVYVSLGAVDGTDEHTVHAWLDRFHAFFRSNRAKLSVAAQANMAEPALGQDLADILDDFAVRIVRALGGGIAEPPAMHVELVRFLLIALDRYGYVTEIQGVVLRDAIEDAIVANIMWTLQQVARQHQQ